MIEIPQKVSISAWAAERDNLGLQVKGSIVNSGPDGLSVTLILNRFKRASDAHKDIEEPALSCPGCGDPLIITEEFTSVLWKASCHISGCSFPEVFVEAPNR